MELTQNDNWYAYLRLPRDATAQEIAGAVERLSRQASALSVTAPERSQLLRETIRAMKRDLLSGPENRRRYDVSGPRGLAPPPAAVPPASLSPAPRAYRPESQVVQGPQAPQAAWDGQNIRGPGSRLAQFLRTGWTCPACGKGGVPSDKFCTKCGTPIPPLRPEPDRGRAPTARAACVTCANPLSPTDVFCAKCGSRR